ncbi:hypothetical protein A9Q99_07660 [Gammaproteobacteria bacterium 45_16_T64]|nr:hypothetical protein A9Q99_07660 [Gammaproteobacteria bacterium 45_16_T64]
MERLLCRVLSNGLLFLIAAYSLIGFSYADDSEVYYSQNNDMPVEVLIVMGRMKEPESSKVLAGLIDALGNDDVFPDHVLVGLAKFNKQGIAVIRKPKELSYLYSRPDEISDLGMQRVTQRNLLREELRDMRWQYADTILYGLLEIFQWVSSGELLFSDRKLLESDRVVTQSLLKAGSSQVHRSKECLKKIVENGISGNYHSSCLSERIMSLGKGSVSYDGRANNDGVECERSEVQRHIIFISAGGQEIQSAKLRIKGGSVGERVNDSIAATFGNSGVCQSTAEINDGSVADRSAFDMSQESEFWQCGESLVATLQHNYSTLTHVLLFGAVNEVPLNRIAEQGGGVFVQHDPDATSASVFIREKLSEIMRSQNVATQSLMSSVAVPLDYLDPFVHQNSIYYSLIQPSQSSFWYGNLKRYELSLGDGDTLKQLSYSSKGQSKLAVIDCGVLNDIGVGSCLAHGRSNYLRARSWWNEAGLADGNIVTKGGAAVQQAALGQRNVFVQTSLNDAQSLRGIHPDFLDLDSTKVNSALYILREKLLETMLGESPRENRWLTLSKKVKDQVRSQIAWLLGHDVSGREGALVGKEYDQLAKHPGESWAPELPKNKAFSRQYYGASLHSRPLIVNYDHRSSAQMQEVVFVTTSDGFMRAVDTATGEELSSFFPMSLLKNIDQYVQRPVGKLAQGIDGIWTVWRHDGDNDGVISAGSTVDFVYLYGGMRRGGRDVLAIDVTDPRNPQLLFNLKPGQSKPLESIGQIWSEPTLARVRLPNVGQPVTVLLLGGGYDQRYDDPKKIERRDDTGQRCNRESVQCGNQIYMVLAQKKAGPHRAGDVLWWSSNTPLSNFVNMDMRDSIVGKIRSLDRDGDGLLDAFYAVDIRGRIFEYSFDGGSGASSNASVKIESRLVAVLGGESRLSSGKLNRFFYDGPSLSIGQDDFGEYTLISVGSGWRASPSDTSMHDGLFVVKDRHEEGRDKPILAESLAVRNNLQLSQKKLLQGFRLLLDGRGEKVFGSPVVLDGKVFFSSYTPNTGVSSVCDGRAKVALYGVDIDTGFGVFDSQGSIVAPSIDASPVVHDLPLSGLGAIRSAIVGNSLHLFAGSLRVGEIAMPPNLVHKISWRQVDRGRHVYEAYAKEGM